MRVAIEALGIERAGGGRVATLNLLRSLLTLDKQNDYLIYLSAPEPSLEGLSPSARQYIFPIRNRFLARLGAQIFLPLHLRYQKVDVVHFAKNQVILGCGRKTVATVYDLTTLRYPQAYPVVDVAYWRHILPRQLRCVRRIIAISQTTADDLGTFYRIARMQISVIYPGYDPSFRVVEQDEVTAARELFGLPEEYFVHVGNISLKKNLSTVIEAFLSFRQHTGFSGKLVLVGGGYHKGHDDHFVRLLSQPRVQDVVVSLGYVPKGRLVGLLNGAQAFVFPSLHEGFGIAVLEAMACGVPVIAHAAGAVREVIGDAGIIIESSKDIDSWSRAMENVLTDRRLREHLHQVGIERARLFTAERCARETLQAYLDVQGESCA